jgi:hypothetical protein
MRRPDRRALEGLPLKLMIISLLLSIAFPLVLGSLAQYESTVAGAEVRSQAERIKAAASSAYISGPGNVRTVRVELPQSDVAGRACLELGGAYNDPGSMRITCVVDGIVNEVLLDEPSFRIVTPNGSRITVGPPVVTVVLECAEIGGRIVVVAEVK